MNGPRFSEANGEGGAARHGDVSDVASPIATAGPRLGRWGALGILMAIAFLNYLDRYLVYPLAKPIKDGLGLSDGQFGALSTGFHVVYACSAPLLGFVSDRFARKTILLVALVTWSAITALSGTADGFASLLVWRSLTGLGEGGYFPTAVSLIGDLFPASERGRALALHSVSTALGGSAGYAVGGQLGERFGWRVPFFLAIVPGLLLAIVLWRAFDEPPRTTRANAEQDAAGPGGLAAPVARPYWKTVTSPAVLVMALAACVGAFSMTGLNAFFPIFLTDVHHLSVSSAGNLTGAFFAAGIAGALVGGVTSDWSVGRLRGARPLLVAAPYAIAAPAVIATAHAGLVSVVLVGYGVSQFARCFAEPNIYGTIIDATSSYERGAAQGFLLMLTFLGASASGAGVGLLVARFDYRVAIDVLAAASALAAVFSGMLVALARRMPRGA